MKDARLKTLIFFALAPLALPPHVGSWPELSSKPNSIRCSEPTGLVGMCVSRFQVEDSRGSMNSRRKPTREHGSQRTQSLGSKYMRAADMPKTPKAPTK